MSVKRSIATEYAGITFRSKPELVGDILPRVIAEH